MQERPDLLREYSKESNPEGRSELAAVLRTERQKAQEQRQARGAVAELEQEMIARSETLFKKLTNYRELKRIREKLASTEGRIEELGEPQESKEIKEKIADFYADERKRFEGSEHDHEEIEKYFDPEYLASIDTESYRMLLQKYPGRLATHVTRQGVRDHVGMMEHSAYVGELSNGMKDILAAGKMVSTLDQQLSSQELSEVAEGLFDQRIEPVMQRRGPHSTYEERSQKGETDVEIAEYWIDYALANPGYGDRLMVDKLALHFGSEYVLDKLYGAETGNESFVVLPAHALAHRGLVKDSWDRDDKKQNDLYFLPDELGEGYPLNAALVFLPEDSKVSRSHGSLYEIDADGKVETRTELLNAFSAALDDSELEPMLSAFIDRRHVYDWEEQQQEEKEKEQLLGEKLPPEVAAVLAQSYHYQEMISLHSLLQHRDKAYGHTNQQIAERLLFELGLSYEKAQDTISGKEYWEAYFAAHPEQRPPHVIYYSGSPNDALRRWLDTGARLGAHTKATTLPEEVYPERFKTENIQQYAQPIETEMEAALKDVARRRYGVPEKVEA